MHSFTFTDVADILGVKPLQQYSNPVIETLLTDSRKLLLVEGVLFFAISSNQKNADDFIAPLYKNGVRCFIIQDHFNTSVLPQFPEANFIKVHDVIMALQQIAARHRREFQYPVIGITGSNGKTIVKEWLYHLLHEAHDIVRSPKSYNSQVGVPLSVWQMNEVHNLGIFEAGISRPGEMQQLQPIIDPSIGVISYIGDAHAEGFENLSQKISEKLQLFIHSKKLIYCADDELLHSTISNFIKTSNPSLQTFSWSTTKTADLVVNSITKKDAGSVVKVKYAGGNFDYFIPFEDDASVHNSLTCCSVLLAMNIAPDFIAVRMSLLRAVEMRLELKQGINNCAIINDSYSADINSLAIAMDFLMQQQQHTKHTVILSDVLQSGQEDNVLYKNIATVFEQKGLHRFIGIGPNITSHANAFAALKEKTFFLSTEDFLKQLPSFHFNDETILLKGARVFRFETISRALEQKMHETVLEINLSALRNNFKVYKQQLNKNVKLMAMVKAFSYGSGSHEIAGLLQHAGADYLAVAYADEGVELRKAGVRLPIMVMNTEEAGFDTIVNYALEPELYSFKILHSFYNYLEQHQIAKYPVHIKLDTGMHRLGFEPADVLPLCNVLKEAGRFTIQSVFSHLVASDDSSHDAFTNEQAKQFEAMVAEMEKVFGSPMLKHIANTSAIHRRPDLQYDMVRLGIGLYGVDPDIHMQQRLQNVTTLKTTISQIKKVKAGESVGYSRKGMVTKDSVIATVRIGYADGYPRSMSNGAGKMLVNGQLAPVIGNVCMDMTMLDITGLDAEETDEVMVFGQQLPVSKMATWGNTIAYEILTNISRRVRRVYYEE